MANLTATQLLKAIVKAQNSIFGEAEMRTYQHSLLGRLIANENQVFTNLNALKQSDEQPTKAILFNRVYTASGTAKTAAHSGAFGDSFEKDIAYIKRVQPFAVSYKQAANNQFTYEEILSSQMRNAIMNLYEDISAYAVSWLDTNKSQVGTDSIIPFVETGAPAPFEFQNPAASKDRFFDYLKAAMRKNKYIPTYDVVGDQTNAAEFRRIAAQGSGNATNLSYTIPGLDYIEEEQIANTANGIAYAWQKGMVGMTSWNERLNRQGFGDPGDNQGFFTTVQDPVFGLLHDLHIKRDISDTSASNGNPQDVVDQYELTTIFTIQGAFISNANETSIFKFAQL